MNMNMNEQIVRTAIIIYYNRIEQNPRFMNHSLKRTHYYR